MNTKAIRQLADVTLDKYRSSIPRKAFEEFVKDIIAGENRATAFRYERKKYRNRIRRYVFEALAAEGGGGP